jgi:hypothetical protein
MLDVRHVRTRRGSDIAASILDARYFQTHPCFVLADGSRIVSALDAMRPVARVRSIAADTTLLAQPQGIDLHRLDSFNA